jgi:hypothetical protein
MKRIIAMGYDAVLHGKIKWICDACGVKVEAEQKSYGVNMKRSEMQFNVIPPADWQILPELCLVLCPDCTVNNG